VTPRIKTHRAVIDADALAKIRVADLLLTIAENTDLCELCWSAEILDEVERTHRYKLHWPESALKKFRRSLETKFPRSMIRGYARWLSRCTNDEGDRHVLACAIEAGAPVILTYNKRHFRAEHLAPWGITQMSPDDYLLTLCEKSLESVLDQLMEVARKNKEPHSETLRQLAPFAPNFVAQLTSELR